ncbi:MAG: hypothetical protein ACREHD_08415, partial [Pirellulales bacterium]
MNGFLLAIAQNSVVAVIFALFVYALTRLVRNPPLAHALWLLVLLKLVSPPLMRIDWLIQVPVGSVRASGQSFAGLPPGPMDKNER